MSDGTFPPDDEIVSAHLDGEATPADAARIEADPRLRRRRDELANARELMAQPVVPTAAQREAAIDAALAVFDEQRRTVDGAAGLHQGPATAVLPADELAARRAAPLGDAASFTDGARAPGSAPGATRGASAPGTSRGRARSATILAIAAAFVLVLLGVGAVVRVAQRSTDTTTAASGALRTTIAPSEQNATAEKRAEAGSGAAKSPSGGDASSSPAAAPTSTVPATTSSAPAPSGATPSVPAATPGAPDPRAYSFQSQSLGAISTPDQLRAKVVASLQAQDTASSQAPTAPSAASGPVAARALAAVVRCDATTRATDPELGPLVLSAPATYTGTDALVLVYGIDRAAHPAANGASRIYAVDATTCAVLDSQTG